MKFFENVPIARSNGHVYLTGTNSIIRNTSLPGESCLGSHPPNSSDLPSKSGDCHIPSGQRPFSLDLPVLSNPQGEYR